MEKGNINFVAIDFETMTPELTSACAVGMVQVVNGVKYKKSFKTTQDIATELDDMGGVSIEAINQYLQEHGYYVATLPDGTVAWALWERVVRPDKLV